MSSIWSDCKERFRFQTVSGKLIRIVESQEQVATSTLVDNLDEQNVLEEIIEQGKPKIRPGTDHLDYLLKTPFRYPPLDHGSRFGARFEPSIFYGSLNILTVLAESAFYRFFFWTGMEVAPRSGRIVTQHTTFHARYRTTQGARLQDPPFDVYQAVLRSPTDYGKTQELGGDLRNSDVYAFEYVSARDAEAGLNVAILDPCCFESPYKATDLHPWSCITTAESVTFMRLSKKRIEEFSLAQFLVNGEFPMPPN